MANPKHQGKQNPSATDHKPNASQTDLVGERRFAPKFALGSPRLHTMRDLLLLNISQNLAG
jgi:hypothetical protein